MKEHILNLNKGGSMKTLLPEKIKTLMKWYVDGLIDIPSYYLQFHKDLAEQEVIRLKQLGFKEVEQTKIYESDGWMDGMKVVHIQMVFDNKIFNLHWHDGNQEFFEKSQTGGSFPLEVQKREKRFISNIKEEDIDVSKYLSDNC